MSVSLCSVFVVSLPSYIYPQDVGGLYSENMKPDVFHNYKKVFQESKHIFFRKSSHVKIVIF